MEETYQIVTDNDGRKHLHFFKNPKLGFDFEFDIYRPENIRIDANLLLSFYDKIDLERMEAMLDALQAPIMITSIEDSTDEHGKETIRYKQFEKSAFINEDGSKVGYGTIDTSIIEQYKVAIAEAYKVLKQMQIIKEDKEERIDVEGYSAQGVKAQRLAFLIPECIRSAIIVGAISSIPLPVDEIDGTVLQYPTGTTGLEDIIGKENLEQWKKDYEKLIQIYYATEYELKYDGNYTIEGKRIERDKNRTKVESAYSDISVSQHDISPETAETISTQILLWGTDIHERIKHDKETINSNGCN
ncbi:MAG: hypothetical protein J6O41_00070, partial [Clostridia bacterium]|nr:hypothetical protein [Clostridia bacterium]